MFEVPQDNTQARGTKKWIVAFVLIAIAGVGALFYTMSKGGAKLRAPVAAAPAPAGPAAPGRDLKVFSRRMEKDLTGTTAVWLVDLRNKSAAYTYSSIQYETTYIGGDNRVLTVNKGTMAITLEPGEEKNS